MTDEHHHDDHHDDPTLHQAPWVVILTLVACFGFTAAMLVLRAL